MTVLEAALIMLMVVGAFVAGLRLDAYYQNKAANETKTALEKQFLRLKSGSDADDPCKPYVWSLPEKKLQTGDFDGDRPNPLPPECLHNLKENGKAVAKFRRSDIAK